MSADLLGSTPRKGYVMPMAPKPGIGRGMGKRSRTPYREATADRAIDPVKRMVRRPKGSAARAIAASCKVVRNTVKH